ncbi:hypothetical protein ABK040_014022 [Willaertia magna]
MLGSKAIKTTSQKFIHRGTQKIFQARGLGRSGNESGILHDKPDWSYLDGTPGPLSKRATKKITIQKYFLERLMRLAVESDQDALKHIEKEPSVRAHRQSDVSFYFDLLEQGFTIKGVKDKIKILKDAGKIPM